MADSLHGAPALNAPDDVWMHQEKHRRRGVSYGSAYMMRTVLWCVSIFWAAKVWHGVCGVCGQRLASWNAHHWLEQVPFTLQKGSDVTVGDTVDRWHVQHTQHLLSLLINCALNCTAGGTACGRPAARPIRFGSVLPEQPTGWPSPGRPSNEDFDLI